MLLLLSYHCSPGDTILGDGPLTAWMLGVVIDARPSGDQRMPWWSNLPCRWVVGFPNYPLVANLTKRQIQRILFSFLFFYSKSHIQQLSTNITLPLRLSSSNVGFILLEHYWAGPGPSCLSFLILVFCPLPSYPSKSFPRSRLCVGKLYMWTDIMIYIYTLIWFNMCIHRDDVYCKSFVFFQTFKAIQHTISKRLGMHLCTSNYQL